MRALVVVACLPVTVSDDEQQQQQQQQSHLQLRKRQQNAAYVDFGSGAAQRISALRAAKNDKEEEQATKLWRMRREIFRTGDTGEWRGIQQEEDMAMQQLRETDPSLLSARQSVVSKRKLAEDAMVAALRRAKFGRTFSSEAVKSMSHFLDRMIVEAASLKHQAGYAHLAMPTRLRFCIDETRVVPLIRWLRHNNLTVARIGEIVAYAGREQLDTIRPKIEWLKQVNVRGPNLGYVLTREPSLIYCSFDQLNQRASILENAGLKRQWMGFVISRSPRVLTLSQEELLRRIQFFVELGIDEYKFGVTAYNLPKLLGTVPLEEMEEKVEFLRGFGLSDDRIGEMVVVRPEILESSMELAWQPVIRFLYYLGIERSGLRRILAVNPAVLCLDLAEHVTPKVHFLRAIGVEEEVIGQLIVNFPAILSYSLDKRIRPVVSFLIQTANVSEHEVGKVIAAQPELIGCSLTNKLESNVKFFVSLGIQPHQLGEMISNFPMLLKYSSQVMLPKYRYLRRVMDRSLEEVIRFPRFFSYALETRIVTRHETLVAKGLTFELRHMLACSDDEFARRVARHDNYYNTHDDEATA